jgi:hypothetical protein
MRTHWSYDYNRSQTWNVSRSLANACSPSSSVDLFGYECIRGDDLMRGLTMRTPKR